jgi:hypothetical protein
MKITVVKKSTTRIKAVNICPFVCDNPPDGSGQQR